MIIIYPQTKVYPGYCKTREFWSETHILLGYCWADWYIGHGAYFARPLYFRNMPIPRLPPSLSQAVPQGKRAGIRSKRLRAERCPGPPPQGKQAHRLKKGGTRKPNHAIIPPRKAKMKLPCSLTVCFPPKSLLFRRF